MFVRKYAVRQVVYLALVENQWDPFKKRYQQNRIASLGKLSELEFGNHRIDRMVTALDSFCKKHGIDTIGDGIILTGLSSNEEAVSSSFDFGIYRVAAATLTHLGLTSTVASLPEETHISGEKVRAAMEALIAHHLLPRTDASERSTHDWYEKELYIPGKLPLTLTDFYRTLDILIENKDEIEKAYYEKNRDLFNGKLDLVLFDTTSIYYWGVEGPSGEKDLLQYGFSKDGKGNTADVNSFSRIVTILKEKYQIEKVILIADRGMVSEENIVHLEQSGLSYIVGLRMRLLPQTLKKKLLIPLDEEEERYELEFMDKASDNLYVTEFPVSKFSDSEINDLFIEKIKKGKSATFNEITIREQVRKRRFFVCLNPLVKEGTKKKREFFTRVIEKKIKSTPTKEWIIKNGYKKYLKFEKGLSPSLDYDRLKDEEVYDGKWIVMTNEKGISSYTAGSYYKTLQTIERGFRDLKSLISVQPIFHFKEERIRAHIFVAFLTLIAKWYVCRMLNPYSQEEGRSFLKEAANLKAILVDKTSSLYLRTELNQRLKNSLVKLGMKLPEKILFDGRRGKKINHAGGRPKQHSPGQLQLHN